MKGTVTTGEGKAAKFVPLIADLVADELGFTPFAGTLNLVGISDRSALPKQTIDDTSLGLDNCRGVEFCPCSAAGVRGALIRPIVEGYPESKTELIAPVRLRTIFDLTDGDTLTLSNSAELGAPEAPTGRAAALDEFEAVVFDLDRTLVDLQVDWGAVKSELDSLLGDYLSEPIHEESDVDLQAIARTHGVGEAYQDLLATYETEGASRAERRELLEVLPKLDCPVGICTKNAEAAAELALEQFGVLENVDALVARETVAAQKPDPEPLQHCLKTLDVVPGDAVFIGDDPSDRRAASGAGTSYLHPNRLDVK